MQLQPVSLNTWKTKYQLKSKDGLEVDKTIQDTYRRVARALADTEKQEVRQYWYLQFLWALENGATGAGRIMSNLGAQEHKPNTSTINCTVSGTIEDSMHGILMSVYEAGITLAAGCGIGYDCSTIRPKGAYVAGVGAKTSGTLSFMEIHDKMCGTVASAGGRRGAQMLTMSVNHPMIREFITAKRQDGMFRQFNFSVLITEEFMRSVENDEGIPLYFPWNKKEPASVAAGLWAKWPAQLSENYNKNDDGKVWCKVYEVVQARELWNLIMDSNYNFAEPGFILIDKINYENNLWFCEDIRATNPCGEQPLPPYGSCLLGSINLTKFVTNAFTNEAFFDFDKFVKVVSIFTRMLDNVVELNGLPLQQQRDEILKKRRHGMGFYGLGSALTMLRIRYGSDDAVTTASAIARQMATIGWEVAVALSKEKGCAPLLQDVEARNDFLQSGYMQRLLRDNALLRRDILEHGVRFTHHTSIAPTGTISLTFGNNCSNGIEPSFAHKYTRNMIVEGRNTKDALDVYSHELLAYAECMDWPVEDIDLNVLPDYFATAETLTPDEHIRMQAAVQPWIDSAISKTVNVPTDITLDAFKQIYISGWKAGLKGMSTFRFNPVAFQGVLVKKSDLEATKYTFKLADGTEFEAQGDEQIEYDGQMHSAANLADAIKEGLYGRM